ncbi:hypothetical protein GGD65_003387 [Bradyrhizobium sp. CIR18]|nr:hypothetical protein [Bradyrhizobium sp. CIR18]
MGPMPGDLGASPSKLRRDADTGRDQNGGDYAKQGFPRTL